jgi:uncharacterized membrane protein (UPF0127 family)
VFEHGVSGKLDDAGSRTPAAMPLREKQFSAPALHSGLRRACFPISSCLRRNGLHLRLDLMNPVRLIFAIVAPLVACAVGAQSAGRQLPTRSLTAGVHLITAEVAADDQSRELGLMYRHDLEPNHGMLFVFDPAFKACMWMRNTLIPLSVAFIDADGRVVNIEEMQPQTDQVHCARHDVPFALEMAHGWFAERSLKPGQTVIGGLQELVKTAKP